MRYPGEYEFMYVLSEHDKNDYYALTEAQRMTIKSQIDQKIRDAIYIGLLENWDFAHNKIPPGANGYLVESEIRYRLEGLIANLGKPGYILTIKPGGQELLPAVLAYDKEFDCGRSCHHTYDVYRADQTPPVPWILTSNAYPNIEFQVRVSYIWIAPPQYYVHADVPHPDGAAVEERARNRASKLTKGRTVKDPKPKGRPVGTRR